MLKNIGFPELLIIALIVLLIFGANRLPQLGEGIGKAIRGLKRGLASNDDIEVSPGKQISEQSSAEPGPKRTEARDAEKKNS